MSNTPQQGSARDAIRLRSLTVENFRTFREATEIPLPTAEGSGITVFHGDNGSGKSNALAAIGAFFMLNGGVALTAPSGGMASGPRKQELPFPSLPLRLDALFTASNGSGLSVRFAGEHPGSSNHFALNRSHSGDAAVFARQRAPTFARIDARRRHPVLRRDTEAVLDPDLGDRLFNLKASFEPWERARWKSFLATFERFPTFAGREITIERLKGGNETPEIIVEEPGRSVLRLSELSSGEQQLIVLTAQVLLANANIVAIEEPELSLDAKNQALLRGLLEEQIAAGLVDQIILESHVAMFDGPNVVRFERAADGSTKVSQAASDPNGIEVAAKARASGAEERWVSQDGFTQLPEVMRRDLGVESGAPLWFLKGKRRWEAWNEAQLGEVFGDGDKTPSDDDA